MIRARNFFFLAAFLLSPIIAHGQVRDDGNFFSDDAVKAADDATQKMMRDTGKQLLIETYPAVPQERAAAYSPSEKDAFFKKWGNERATTAHVNGVFILINKDPSYLFVTSGNKTQVKDFTSTDANDLRALMLPLMKQKQFDAALGKATDFVSQRIQNNRAQSSSTGVVAPTRAPTPPANSLGTSGYSPTNSPPLRPQTGFGFGGVIVVLIVLGVGLMILRAIFRGMMGRGSPGPGDGAYSNYSPGNSGGGFGRGFLGGMLGGMASGWLQNRMSGFGRQDSTFGSQPPIDTGGPSSFGDSSGDTSFSGGTGGSFDSGPSGGSDSSSDGGAGGSF